MAGWTGGENAPRYHLPHVSSRKMIIALFVHPTNPFTPLHPTPLCCPPPLHTQCMPAETILVWRSHRTFARSRPSCRTDARGHPRARAAHPPPPHTHAHTCTLARTLAHTCTDHTACTPHASHGRRAQAARRPPSSSRLMRMPRAAAQRRAATPRDFTRGPLRPRPECFPSLSKGPIATALGGVAGADAGHRLTATTGGPLANRTRPCRRRDAQSGPYTHARLLRQSGRLLTRKHQTSRWACLGPHF
jgi:hypothetical protein